MGEILLSASVPMPGRGSFHEDADPFLIQFAIRELLTVVLGRRRLVWGGHPAITPMVWSVCSDLGVEYAGAVQLYQSRFFAELFPEENAHFRNVVYTEPVAGDEGASIAEMRNQMLDRDFEAAVFVGGMEGIFDEYQQFHDRHPHATVVAVGAGGGAARQLARKLDQDDQRIDFTSLFSDALKISPLEGRDLIYQEQESHQFFSPP